ncbi:MAG: TRAP transporter large permease subunit [Arhodomonas sp.]|nr:TRAP transporter large permease subunit [Arhodomonas sp.]
MWRSLSPACSSTPIVVILVLTPIFAPAIEATGLDPVHVGILITLQVAIGSATPPSAVTSLRRLPFSNGRIGRLCAAHRYSCSS